MSRILDTLTAEIAALDHAGAHSLDALVRESSLILLDLKELEADLEDHVARESQAARAGANTTARTVVDDHDMGGFAGRLERRAGAWHSASLGALKQYNGQLLRFVRSAGSGGGGAVDLDDAYAFPLALGSFPARKAGQNGQAAAGGNLAAFPGGNGGSGAPAAASHTQLMRSIVLHFVKTGHAALVAELLDDFRAGSALAPGLLARFLQLGDIVREIRENHDITRALAWFQEQGARGHGGHEPALFKFHMLQFVLLLAGHSHGGQAPGAGGAGAGLERAFAAYAYAKSHFPAHFKRHVDDIAPVLSLLLFPAAGDEDSTRHMALLRQNVHRAFVQGCEAQSRRSRDTRFVAEMLEHFDTLHANGAFFDRLAHDFVQEFCKGLALSTESSLFQAVLAGHVNLPNFYKYSQLQQRLRRPAPPGPRDLPFSLSSKNQFLFDFHPIFICPVSKEQLMPLVSVATVADVDVRDRKRKQIFVSPHEVLVSPTNPVVVFGHCHHLALKESVRQLTKGGAETFKCHYCYKKHKLDEVSDAYFIDL